MNFPFFRIDKEQYCWLHRGINRENVEKYKFHTSITEIKKKDKKTGKTITTIETFNFCPRCCNTVKMGEDKYEG